MKTEAQRRSIGLLLLFSLVLVATGGGMADEASRVVIVPFKMNADRDLSFLKEGIVDMLTSRLSGTVVVAREDTDQALKDISVPVNEEIAQTIGVKLQADHVLFGSLTIFGNSISLDAKMVDVHQKRPTLTFFKQSEKIDEVIPQIDLLATQINETVLGRPVSSRQPPGQVEVGERPAAYAHPESLLTGESSDQAKVPSKQPAPAAASGFEKLSSIAPVDITSAGYWKSQDFKVEIKGISIGDVDGNGRAEVVFISDQSIYVYRFENKRFLKIKEMAGKRHQRFISVDAADINGNGCAEIFVTSLKGTGQSLDSFVLEWNGDDFSWVNKDGSWYYRVINVPGRGDVLLGQKRRLDEPFVPGIFQLAWRNGEYGPEERLTLPKGINIYGFALGDVMNNGQQMIVAFNEGDHILLFTPSGKEQWKSDEPYGGSMNYLELDLQHGPGDTERIYLPQRILIRDMDGDGEQDVIAVSNQGSLGRLLASYRRFESGHMACLSWNRLGLTPKWRTPKISGHFSDCAIGDFDHDGRDEVVAVQVGRQGKLIRRARSSIIGYELPQSSSAR